MENGWTETGNGGKWRTMERSGLQRETGNKQIEMGNGEKQRTMGRSGVVRNGNGRTGWCCGVVRMCGECDRLVWNVVEGLGPNRGVRKWCWSHESGLNKIICDSFNAKRNHLSISYWYFTNLYLL